MVARSAVPDNVVAAAVNMNILGIITFSLFFGLCLSQLGEQADGLISLVNVRLANLLFYRKTPISVYITICCINPSIAL